MIFFSEELNSKKLRRTNYEVQREVESTNDEVRTDGQPAPALCTLYFVFRTFVCTSFLVPCTFSLAPKKLWAKARKLKAFVHPRPEDQGNSTPKRRSSPVTRHVRHASRFGLKPGICRHSFTPGLKSGVIQRPNAGVLPSRVTFVTRHVLG